MFLGAAMNLRIPECHSDGPIYIESNNTILDFCTNLNYDLRACTVDNQEMNDQGRQVWGS